MKIKLRLLDWNLRHKIILHVLVIGLITAILLIFIYIRSQNRLIRTVNLQKSEFVGAMIECNVTYHMQGKTPENIATTLERIAETGSLRAVRIIDEQGKILNSSQKEEIGVPLDENTRKVLDRLFADQDSPDIFKLKSVSSTRGFMAIENKPECFECHSAEKKINGIVEVRLDETATTALLQKAQVQAVIIALLSLVVLIVIILRLFEKIINRPLSQLKNQMRRVEAGDLGVQLQPKKQDEIGDLTLSFNTMVRKLDKAQQEIASLHEQQMERAGHLASLGELAAGLAHEIKNPIAGIKGSLEIIKDRTPDEDPQKEIFTEILSQTEKIYSIIQDLLVYARPKELHFSSVMIDNAIMEAINLARPQIRDKDIRIEFQGLGENTRIRCDGDKIQELVLNLLLNSIAAIDTQGIITVEIINSDPHEWEIRVSDNGRGIPQDHLPAIFTPFFTTRKKGTGLGLSICKQIVEAHKGNISVESQEGEGTTFSIRLPRIHGDES